MENRRRERKKRATLCLGRLLSPFSPAALLLLLLLSETRSHLAVHKRGGAAPLPAAPCPGRNNALGVLSSSLSVPPRSGMQGSSPRMSCCGDKYLHLCCHSGNDQPVNFLLPDTGGPKNRPSLPPPPPRGTIDPQLLFSANGVDKLLCRFVLFIIAA